MSVREKRDSRNSDIPWLLFTRSLRFIFHWKQRMYAHISKRQRKKNSNGWNFYFFPNVRFNIFNSKQMTSLSFFFLFPSLSIQKLLPNRNMKKRFRIQEVCVCVILIQPLPQPLPLPFPLVTSPSILKKLNVYGRAYTGMGCSI